MKHTYIKKHMYTKNHVVDAKTTLSKLVPDNDNFAERYEIGEAPDTVIDHYQHRRRIVKSIQFVDGDELTHELVFPNPRTIAEAVVAIDSFLKENPEVFDTLIDHVYAESVDLISAGRYSLFLGS